MSSFFYTNAVTLDNNFLSFAEGGPEKKAELDVGARSPTDLLTEVSRAMNVIGTQVYTVTFNRITNRVTISAPSNFSLLVFSGTTSTISVFGLLGFTGADRTGANTYTGDSDFVSIYRPQFFLQSYVPFDKYREAIQASVNESANGVLEILSFGERQFMEFILDYITDIDQGSENIIETNLTGVNDCLDFMNFLILRSPFEFVPDRDLQNTYIKIQLEKTSTNQDGVGFKLNEKIGDGLAGYFDSGKLTFRKVN